MVSSLSAAGPVPCVLLLMAATVHGTAASASPPSTGVEIDLSATPTPFEHFWKASVGSGHAKLGLRKDWQAQLAAVNRSVLHPVSNPLKPRPCTAHAERGAAWRARSSSCPAAPAHAFGGSAPFGDAGTLPPSLPDGLAHARSVERDTRGAGAPTGR